MKDRINTSLLILLILTLLTSFDCLGLLQRYAEGYVKDVYFIGCAVSWQIVSVLVWLLVKETGSKLTKILSIIFILFAMNNLTDEILFDPYVTGWNEYVFGIAAVIWAQYFIQSHE